MSQKVVFANFPFVSSDGTFEYKTVSLQEAKEVIYTSYKWDSAIGHQATADVVSELFSNELLGQKCPVNRINYCQEINDVVIVVKLNQRQQEGAILDRETLEKIGYTIGILRRLS